MKTAVDNKVFITDWALVTEPLSSLNTVKAVKTVLRSEELILGAVSEVLSKADGFEREDAGVVLGADNAIDACKEEFYRAVLTDGPLGASPLVFPYTSANAITAQVTIAFGLRHESFTITDGPLSFLKAVETAFNLIRFGVCKAVITGGVSQNAAFTMLMQAAIPPPDAAKTEITGAAQTPAPSDPGQTPSMEETFADMAALLANAADLRIVKSVDKTGGNMVSIMIEPSPSNER